MAAIHGCDLVRQVLLKQLWLRVYILSTNNVVTKYLYLAPVLEFIPQFIEPSQNKSYTKEGHLRQA